MLTIQPSDGYEKYLFDKAFDTKTPISGTFELLPICNMDCHMCYIRITREEMNRQGQMLTAKQWLQIAEQAAKKGTLFLLLTGGEPLLHPEFSEIYQGLRSLGMCITINTNGTLITEKLADLWQKNLPRRINISLYGSSDELYGKLCKNPKGFSQVMYGIQLLKERKIPVKLNCTLTPENRDDMDQIIRLSEELEVPVSTPTYLFPPGRKISNTLCGAISNTYRLSPKEAASEQVKAIYRAFHEDIDYEQNLQSILDDIKEKEKNRKERGSDILPPGGFLCSAGASSFWVNWKGEMTPCGMMQTPSRNLLEQGFEESWEAIKNESSQIVTSVECFNCKYRKVCQTCAASACVETGSFSNIVPYHCEMSKEYERLIKKHLSDMQKENQ